MYSNNKYNNYNSTFSPHLNANPNYYNCSDIFKKVYKNNNQIDALPIVFTKPSTQYSRRDNKLTHNFKYYYVLKNDIKKNDRNICINNMNIIRDDAPNSINNKKYNKRYTIVKKEKKIKEQNEEKKILINKLCNIAYKYLKKYYINNLLDIVMK